MKSMRYILPLLLFTALLALLLKGLGQDPKEVPSPLVGKLAPAFTAPQLHVPEKQFSASDMNGKVWILNVWASWCFSCRAEHELVTRMAREHGIVVVGLNYKDEPADAKAWLQQFGNPYVTSVMDPEGDIGIEYGVYGVPESFIIDKAGVIRRKVIGPINDSPDEKPQNSVDELLAFLSKLEAES
jgi:cytochrome c biogenesis protein CcmG/thiol:disulfide interchange protein DsbE